MSWTRGQEYRPGRFGVLRVCGWGSSPHQKFTPTLLSIHVPARASARPRLQVLWSPVRPASALGDLPHVVSSLTINRGCNPYTWHLDSSHVQRAQPISVSCKAKSSDKEPGSSLPGGQAGLAEGSQVGRTKCWGRRRGGHPSGQPSIPTMGCVQQHMGGLSSNLALFTQSLISNELTGLSDNPQG